MHATLDLPIVLKKLTVNEITWLAARSAQLGKSTAEVAHELLRDAAGASRRHAKASTPARKGGRA